MAQETFQTLAEFGAFQVRLPASVIEAGTLNSSRTPIVFTYPDVYSDVVADVVAGADASGSLENVGERLRVLEERPITAFMANQKLT